MSFFSSPKKETGFVEPKRSKKAAKKIAAIAEISPEGIPLQEIAGFSELENQAFALAQQFLQDDSGEEAIDNAIAIATEIAESNLDINSPEVQAILSEVQRTGDEALNRIGRQLQTTGTFSTTAGRDILGRKFSDIESSKIAAISPLLSEFRRQRLQATSLLPNLVGQKAGLTVGRIAVGEAAGSAQRNLRQRILDATFIREQKKFDFETVGRTNILKSLLVTPQSTITGGGPSGLESIVGGASGITSALGSASKIAGGLSAVGGLSGLGAGALALLSDATMKENVRPVTSALDKVEQLTGYTFNYKTNAPENRNGGVMAQDLEKVLPDAVSIKDGVRYVRYDAVVALLVEAIKELNQKIQSN